jgi:hypothetical protein
MRVRAVSVAKLIGAIAIAWTGSAVAQETPVDALYAEGKTALAEARFDAAVAAFGRGLERVATGPNRWRMQLGLALAHEGRAELVEAASFYRAFLHDTRGVLPDPWATRRQAVLDDLTEFDARLAESHARVDLQSEPTGAEVQVEGVSLMARTRTPLVVHLAPGRQTITLHHPAREPVTFSLFLERGQKSLIHKELELPPPPVPRPPPVLPPAPPPGPEGLPPAVMADTTPPHADLTGTQVAGAVGVGVGGGALVVGIALTAAAASAISELEELQTVPVTDEVRARDDELRSRVPRLEAASVGMYVTAGVLGVAGTFMLLLGGEADDTASTAWGLSPHGLALRF